MIGGGVNGAGIAADAAGRGLAVVLAEQDDLAGATSSASSKLVHGGLRYLEHYEFRLVREALSEREVLLAKAPHIIWPLKFVLPHRSGMRPAWMLRAGLFLYDHLGRRTRLGKSAAVDLARGALGEPLDASLKRGFAYYDCWVDDARLVVSNAMQAAQNGARILTRHRLLEATRQEGGWQARLLDRREDRVITVGARALVNATGPWVEATLDRTPRIPNRRKVRLVKGSHIVVPRLYAGDHAYILQHDDGRIVFVLPYEGAYSLIGTTDIAFDGDPATATITADEIAYLTAAVGRYFKTEVRPADVVWSYAGVRPLHDDEADDPSAVTRDYVLDLDAADDAAPLLSIYGGKITTYRRLAEQAVDHLAPFFPGMGPSWTETAALPGGDFANGDFSSLVSGLAARYPGLAPDYLAGLARRHGSLAAAVLGDARAVADLGTDFGGGLYSREVDYLRANEWALTADDVLWRRTKCGLHMDAAARAMVAEYLGIDSASFAP